MAWRSRFDSHVLYEVLILRVDGMDMAETLARGKVEAYDDLRATTTVAL